MASGRSEAIDRLIDIALGDEPPDWQAIRSKLDRWDNMVGLTPDEREQAEVKRIAVELAAGDRELAIELAANHLGRASKLEYLAQFWKSLAEMQLADAKKSEDVTATRQKVLEAMRSIAQDPNADDETKRRSQYFAGLILQKLKQHREAISTLSALRQSSPHTVEGIAATLEEMQALIDLQDYEETSKLMKIMTDQFGDMNWYQNVWYPIPNMRLRTNQLGESLLHYKAYPQTISFAKTLPPYCEKEDRLRLLSQANRRWADSLGNKSNQPREWMDFKKTRDEYEAKMFEQSRLQQSLYNEAAKAFEELAILEMRSPDYPDLTWAAIDCFQAAGELPHCNSIIENYLALEKRDRKPRGILKMAENYFSMQQPDKSIILLRQCIFQFPNHPLSYQARLNAARILAEQSDFPEATSFLDENLYDSDLNPESPVWRESLFELGKLFYRQGELQFSEAQRLRDAAGDEKAMQRLEYLEESNNQFTKSISILEEWIKRYPDDKRRYDTLYCVGQAYRMGAKWPDVLLTENRLTSEDLKRARMIERRKLLDAARQTFLQIRNGINSQGDWASLDNAQQRLLRNSYFGEADLMYQLEDYEGSLSAYRNIANRFMNEPESLEALTQSAECLRKLGRKEESQRVIAQAREILNQIPAARDPQFKTLTRLTRAEWSQLLEWMNRNIF